MDDRDRKKFFGTGKDVGETINRLEATLGRVINESYIEAQCSMDAAYDLAKEKLAFDRRFDNFDRDRLVAKAREVGASGGKMDWQDPWLFGGPKRHGSR